MKRITSITMTLVLILLLAGCSSKKQESAPADQNKQTLTIGLECDYAPYNWTTTEEKSNDYSLPIEGSKGYCSGYDIWLAKQLGNKINRNIAVKKMTWDGLIPALNNGQIDAILAGMSPTDERKEQIGFSDRYFTVNPTMAIVVKKDSKYAKAKELSDFTGANISAQQGTTQVNLLSQIKDNKSTSNLPDYNSLVQATKSGSIDGYLAELQVAQQQVAANDDLTLIDVTNKFKLTEAESTVAIGLRKDAKELKTSINKALSEISEKERVAAMEQATKASK